MFSTLDPYLAEASAKRLRRIAEQGEAHCDERADVCIALVALGIHTTGDAIGHPLGDVFFAIEIFRENHINDPIQLSDEQRNYLSVAANVLDRLVPGMGTMTA